MTPFIGITKGLSPKFAGISGIEIDGIDIGEVMVAAALGGTISEMTGGKFANGAITAAFANVYNAQKKILSAKWWTGLKVKLKLGLPKVGQIDFDVNAISHECNVGETCNGNALSQGITLSGKAGDKGFDILSVKRTTTDSINWKEADVNILSKVGPVTTSNGDLVLQVGGGLIVGGEIEYNASEHFRQWKKSVFGTCHGGARCRIE